MLIQLKGTFEIMKKPFTIEMRKWYLTFTPSGWPIVVNYNHNDKNKNQETFPLLRNESSYEERVFKTFFFL